MVKIKQVELTAEKAIYKYYPEMSDKAGIVILDRKTGAREIKEMVPGYGSNYAAHALRRLEEYQHDGKFLKEDIVAWY